MPRPSLTHYLAVLLTSAVILLLAACVPAEFEPAAQSDNVAGGAGSPIPVTRPTRDNIDTPTPPPTPSATTSAQSVTAQSATTTAAMAATFAAEGRPLPGPGASPTPVPPFPGLVYRNAEGLWQTAADWQPVKLFDRSDVVLAPDGQRAILQRDGDLWLVRRGTGEEQNLTEALDRPLCCAQWWPDRADVVLFGSWDPTEEIGPSSGLLTAVTLNGEIFTLEEETESYALPDPSPDGQTIAYDRAGQPALYHWDEGAQPLSPADYGLSAELSLASPAWSPDGGQLAWAAAGTLEGTWQAAIAVLDMKAGTARLLHPYVPVGRGGWFEPPAWSPDGRWLAFTAEDQDAALYGVWVASADGSQKHYLGEGHAPIWSPDGRWLIYSTSAGTRLVEVESWYQIQMYLPGEGQPVDWLPVTE